MSRYDLACQRTGENGSTLLSVTLTDTATGKAHEPVSVTRATLADAAGRIAGMMEGTSAAEVQRQLCRELDAAAAPTIPDVLEKRNPLPSARKFIRDNYHRPDGDALLLSGDSFYEYDGPAYVERDAMAVRSRAYAWGEHQRVVARGPDGEATEQPFKPTKTDVENILDATRALTYTTARPPVWLSDDPTLPDAAHLLVARNGIYHLGPEGVAFIGKPTPRLFTTNALSYDFDPNAPEPVEWFKFLSELWSNDEGCISLIQQWFGYCLTADTSLQKILMLIGPPRSGKGTLMRVLMHLIGVNNCCAPTLAGIGTNFGLWPLIDKRLAVVSDARLSNRSDQAVVTERLLSISGEDFITIDRKNRSPLTLKLAARIALCTNELPRLADASGALANRFLILPLQKSFLGHEDPLLTDRLLSELPGILRWAADGWRQLQRQGHFIQPATGQQAIEEMSELSSPVTAFLGDCCQVEAGRRVIVQDLFDAWCLWCKEQGREQPGNKQVFGRDLRAARPGIGTSQATYDERRVRVFDGVDLNETAKETLRQSRVNEEYRAARWGGMR